MSAREQADSVRQSRKAFKRSLCRLFLKGLKEQSGGRDGERVGGGGGRTFPCASFPTSCCWMWTRWMVIYVSSDLYCLELLHFMIYF